MTAPTLIIGSKEEFQGGIAQGNRQIRDASAADHVELIELDGEDHGTDNFRTGQDPAGHKLEERVRKFVSTALRG